jgi:hypothetical protein
MGLSISLEVHIPDNVDRTLVTRIGLACYPYDGLEDEPLDIGEALQWAFQSPWGVGELASLGVTWNAQHQVR